MTETKPQNRHLGYARVSTYGQTLNAQLEQLRGAGCTKIYREKVTGAHSDARGYRGDLGIRVGPCIFRVRDQPIDRPALDLVGRPRSLISGALTRAGARTRRGRGTCARRSPAKRILSLGPGALNSTEAAMSRTIKFAKAGGPEVLEFVEAQVPAPGPHEVRIKVRAIGINRAEAMWRVDEYIERVKFPAGLGYEAAGTVDAVGKDVGGFAVGDEVNVIPSFSLNDYSTYGEVILVPDHAVVRQPKSLSFTEAASVWMMFVTAYGALIEDAKVAKGDFVLIPAASSSVGLAAIQLANYAGATTIALTRTSECAGRPARSMR
jgi:hypothetical protein